VNSRGDSTRFWIGLLVLVLSVGAFVFEAYLIFTEQNTISRVLRDLGEKYHPVYWFSGMVTLLVFSVGLDRDFPTIIRAAGICWVAVFSHVFWVLCP